MFDWVIGPSLIFGFLLLTLSGALLVFGTERFREMPIDALPEFAPPKMEIQTVGPAMTAAGVEKLINIAVEGALH